MHADALIAYKWKEMKMPKIYGDMTNCMHVCLRTKEERDWLIRIAVYDRETI